jgi:hypothetical protein
MRLTEPELWEASVTGDKAQSRQAHKFLHHLGSNQTSRNDKHAALKV